MAEKRRRTMDEVMRKAVRDSGLSLPKVAIRAGLYPQTVIDFMRGGDLYTRSAEKLAASLGLALRPVRQG